MRLLLPAILFLAACSGTNAPVSSTSTGTGTPGDLGSCNATALAGSIGQHVDTIRDRLPAPHRVLGPGTVVTQDFRPDRLNVYVNDEAVIERLTCG
ncbi:I78 family peptidase inhibitor [Lutimaribacter marinistellae]|uniref:I78 family peptidase inhibitor n=1 Tax=Lutimaribacter marinistellae TaxID=1820329 RepID=A0ABV7TCH0_9RHOB